MTRKIKQAKKCTECGKVLRDHNKTRLCSHHYTIVGVARRRKERIRNHLCIDCKKEVEIIAIYPARCKCCRERQKVNKKNYDARQLLKKRVVTTK